MLRKAQARFPPARINRRYYNQPYDFFSLLNADLFAGGMLEPPRNNPGAGFLGTTLSNIVAEQFRRLKFGDRLFYQNPLAGFTSGKSLPNFSCFCFKFDKKTLKLINFNSVLHYTFMLDKK